MTLDDDIRRDFLLEAGDLVQRLTEQLMELERRPQDPGLLNAIFRAFHTVKGGAGFLELTPLVELCHVAEDVCNGLRNGTVQADSSLLDVLLAALDQVQLMLDALAQEQPLIAAPAELVAALRMTALSAETPKPEPMPAPASDTITDDEFEALLDQLHGKGQAIAGTRSIEENVGGVEANAETRQQGRDSQENVGWVEANAETQQQRWDSQAHPSLRVPSPPAPLPPAGEGSTAVAKASLAAPADAHVRVDTLKLDRMMNLVGELVLVRNRLKALRERSATDAVSRAIGELDFITRSLQGAVMQVRMQPIKRVFARFPKLARDVARQLGKQVEVELQGEDTDLDKNLVEALADPLLHMMRNSVDHGIELPELRLRAGKPAAGRLLLAAQQEGDHIVITVRDDGAGIDPERLREKALKKGLIDAASAARLSHEDCLELIFLPGFSTKEEVSDLSGRGVGMDVVRSRIRELNGSVHIDSKPGQGTCFRIRVPLTLAILSALMVNAGGRQYALPLSPVLDVFALDDSRVRRLDTWDVVLVRGGETLRLVYLDPWLRPAASDTPRHVAVAQVGDERYGFVVREVRGREEIVIKPLGPSLRGLPGIAGATVLPDGRVALILDLAGLVQAYRQARVQASAPQQPEAAHG